jgi:spore maturation protein CgeB
MPDPTIWEANIEAWRARKTRGDLLPAAPEKPPILSRAAFVSGPHPSLQVPGEKGRLVSLHSAKNPWQEAEFLAERVSLEESQAVVALGMGLGYHVLRLLPRLKPEHKLIIVEKEPEVFFAALGALDLTPLLLRPNTLLVVDPDCRKVIRHLRRCLGLDNGRRMTLFGHPPSLRAHGSFYQEVIRRLKPARPHRLNALGVKQERFRVLILNPDYFLIPEALRAFRGLGHEVQAVLFDKRRDQGEDVLRRILAEVNNYAPDLVFTVNHLGLDRQGLLMEFFHHLRVPFVSWYVDSPAIILNLYAGLRRELAYIFVWDPTYIPEVRALGFEKVFPLPLATDPEIFRPRPASELAPWRSRVAFVGNSLTAAVQEKLARLPSSPEFRQLFYRLVRAYQERPFRRLHDLLVQEELTDHPLIAGLNTMERTDLEAGIIWEATRDHRLACVKRLAPFNAVIYGDPGWRQLVKAPFSLRPEVNYYDELPLVYGAAAINFNVTSLQMKTAVNQRVFDVPAAGGFLLTDYKAQLPELLDVGKAIICYRHPDEIPELASFYLRSSRARAEVISRGRARILQEHTYVHRLRAMVDTIRRTI